MPEIDEKSERRIRRRQTVRVVVVVLLLAVVAAFALDNRESVDVGYLLDESTWPLWTVIAGSVLAGMVIGAVAGRSSD